MRESDHGELKVVIDGSRAREGSHLQMDGDDRQTRLRLEGRKGPRRRRPAQPKDAVTQSESEQQAAAVDLQPGSPLALGRWSAVRRSRVLQSSGNNL
jgi:hypothetical protein